MDTKCCARHFVSVGPFLCIELFFFLVSQIKLVIVVESGNVTLRDNEIRAMFRKLHNAYMDMISSPFYTPGKSMMRV